jgi:hypothetical protein
MTKAPKPIEVSFLFLIGLLHSHSFQHNTNAAYRQRFLSPRTVQLDDDDRERDLRPFYRQETRLREGGPFFEQEQVSKVAVSQWEGAGFPRADLPPEKIPALLMDALRMNDLPSPNAGLLSIWEFAGDTTRHIFQHNSTDFIESAHETADTMATSFYGVAMNGKEWNVESPLNRVGGEDGWIATQVIKTICSDGRVRRWQWELRKHRRPPNLGAWYVESIGSSDRKGNFEPE